MKTEGTISTYDFSRYSPMNGPLSRTWSPAAGPMVSLVQALIVLPLFRIVRPGERPLRQGILYAIAFLGLAIACAPTEEDAAITTPTVVHSPAPATETPFQTPITPTFRPTPSHTPTTAPTLEPTPGVLPLGGMGDHSVLAMAVTIACALESDGKPDCWDFSQDVEPIEGIEPRPPEVLVPPPDESFVSISSGGFHFCGLREDGMPVCWVPMVMMEGFPDLLPPPEGERFASIDTRACYTCGLRPDGTPKCWEQFVDVPPCDDYALAEPPAGERFAALTGTDGYSCGLRPNGTALCYPDVKIDKPDPKLPIEPDATRYIDISSGIWSLCALRQDGAPFCWHWNITASHWAEEGGPPDVEGLVSISTGSFHACGLRATGKAVCWWISHPEDPGPVPPEGTRFVALESSPVFRSCALEMDGSRICWTANTGY